MTVGYNGYVGLGTTSPKSMFDLRGGAVADSMLMTNVDGDAAAVGAQSGSPGGSASLARLVFKPRAGVGVAGVVRVLGTNMTGLDADFDLVARVGDLITGPKHREILKY